MSAVMDSGDGQGSNKLAYCDGRDAPCMVIEGFVNDGNSLRICSWLGYSSEVLNEDFLHIRTSYFFTLVDPSGEGVSAWSRIFSPPLCVEVPIRCY